MGQGKSGLADLLPASLREILAGLPGLNIAFSGGLDSRFLCHAARLCGCQPVAFHMSGAHVARAESAYAQSWAESHGIPLFQACTDPLAIPEVSANGKERCYFCKKSLYEKIASLAAEKDLGHLPLCDGANIDDVGEYRPGLKAAREMNVLSPLAVAKLDKVAIRHYARLTGLENPGQKARPCLLTRFAYGVRPSREKLQTLEKLEEAIALILEQLDCKGVDFRLRFLPETQLHINPIPDTAEMKIREFLVSVGRNACPIVWQDKISGYHDRTF